MVQEGRSVTSEGGHGIACDGEGGLSTSGPYIYLTCREAWGWTWLDRGDIRTWDIVTPYDKDSNSTGDGGVENADPNTSTVASILAALLQF